MCDFKLRDQFQKLSWYRTNWQTSTDRETDLHSEPVLLCCLRRNITLLLTLTSDLFTKSCIGNLSTAITKSPAAVSINSIKPLTLRTYFHSLVILLSWDSEEQDDSVRGRRNNNETEHLGHTEGKIMGSWFVVLIKIKHRKEATDRKLIQDLHKSLTSNSLCATVNTDKTVIYDANINIHM